MHTSKFCTHKMCFLLTCFYVSTIFPQGPNPGETALDNLDIILDLEALQFSL